MEEGWMKRKRLGEREPLSRNGSLNSDEIECGNGAYRFNIWLI